MSTGRKSQLEKFEARQSKAQAITHTIQEENFKKSIQPKNIMERGAQLMNTIKPGSKTEDIAAAITHEGMATFMKLWNNSMEDTIRATMKDAIRPMVSEIVREVIQEELAAAIKGVFSGMNGFMQPQSTEDEIIVEEVNHVEPIEHELPVFHMPLSQRVKEEQELEAPKKKRVGRIPVAVWMNELEELIKSIEDVDPRVGIHFEKKGGRYRSLYQKFMQQYKGVKGAWKAHVEKVLANN